MVDNDYFMQRALAEASTAAKLGEVPVGAVVVVAGEVVGQASNGREQQHDPTAHAEILALQAACRRFGDWRLEAGELFVTVQPCLMCYGAICQSRLRRIVYGCENPKNPAYLQQVYANWPQGPQVVGGVCREACAQLLQRFFANLRLTKDAT